VTQPLGLKIENAIIWGMPALCLIALMKIIEFTRLSKIGALTINFFLNISNWSNTKNNSQLGILTNLYFNN
jgi:hypothetical protein